MSLTVQELIGHGTVSFNATAQNGIYNLLPFAQTRNKRMRVQKTDAGSNTVIINCFSGDMLVGPGTSGPVSSITLLDNADNSFVEFIRPGVAGVPGLIIGGVGSSSGGGSSSHVYDMDQSVTGTVTFNAGSGPVPAVVVPGVFTWRLVQDSTGHVVTWGTGFKAFPPVDTTANTVSAGIAIGGADGNWWNVGYTLGVHQ